MADVIDRAQDTEEIFRRSAVSQAAREIPKGEPGKCEECGEWSPRLVGGNCAYCRDGR